MKLNKPPFTQEQSILEEYVEFLLTDLSNVHPIKVEAKKKISDLISEKETRLPKPNLLEPQKKTVEKDIKEATTKKIPISNEGDETPKWSTIEKAAAKRQKKVKPIIKPTQEKAKRTIQNPHDVDEKIEKAQQNTQQGFIEESEELQLKEWDALITLEKEKEILASQHALEYSKKAPLQISEETENRVVRGPKRQSKSEKTSRAAHLQANDLAHQTREIIESYLPPEAQQDPRLANVEKLLSRISLATLPKVLPVDDKKQVAPESKTTQTINAQQAAEVAQATFMHRDTQRSREILPDVFQTLIFQVAALPLAVPLIKLGGIIKVSDEDITPLVGTPNWFMGLIPNDRGNLMVVDTQRFLMPEKGTSGERQDYQYLIVLDNSNWALACNSVGDAKNLTQDDIRWAQKSSRRPWFAGMVVDYMSALLEVDELINMLADNIVD